MPADHQGATSSAENRQMKHRPDIGIIETQITSDLQQIKGLLDELTRANVLLPDGATADAFASIETFVAISLRIISKTNPSKIRSETVSVEIQSRMQPA